MAGQPHQVFFFISDFFLLLFLQVFHIDLQIISKYIWMETISNLFVDMNISFCWNGFKDSSSCRFCHYSSNHLKLLDLVFLTKHKQIIYTIQCSCFKLSTQQNFTLQIICVSFFIELHSFLSNIPNLFLKLFHGWTSSTELLTCFFVLLL